MNDDNPLTKQHYATLQKMESAAADALKKCDKAEAAGVDCSDLKAIAELYRQRAAQIKAAFFPDRM